MSMSSAASRWGRCWRARQQDRSFAARGLRPRFEALGSRANNRYISRGERMATAAPRRTFWAGLGCARASPKSRRKPRPANLSASLGSLEPGLPRHRLHHRRRHLRPYRQCRRASRRPGRSHLLRDCRHHLRLRRPVLCRVGLDPAGIGLRLHLQLCHDRRVRRLGDGRAAAARIWPCRLGRRGRLVGLYGQPARRLRSSHTGRTNRPDRASSAEGRGRRARQRRAGRLSVQPARLPGLRRACHPAGHRRVGIGASSTTRSLPSR